MGSPEPQSFSFISNSSMKLQYYVSLADEMAFFFFAAGQASLLVKQWTVLDLLSEVSRGCHNVLYLLVNCKILNNV